MDQEAVQKLGIAAGGLLAGVLGYHLLSGGPAPVYTGLSRAYEGGEAGKIMAAIYALPDEGYIVRFERKSQGKVIDPFPDFRSPVLPLPFSAAMYADYILVNLDYKPTGIWAELANQASETYQKERQGD